MSNSEASILGRLRAALVFFALAFVWAAPALAEERITSFVSDVTLRLDGTVDVTEIITVNVEGREIRRGIFRDIPTTLINADGSRLQSNLNVIGVLRDGAPEHYTLESISGGKRIRIGNADFFLPYGPHRYTIHYTMTRMARRFEDHDEVYWNATGNYWVFPIDVAVATVRLPEGARITDIQGYTGGQGQREQAVAITRQADNVAVIRATRSFEPYEGMTVSVSFAKGVLPEPQGFDKVLYWLSDHRMLIVPAIAAFLVLLYNFFAWDAVGRDPKKGTIIPLFFPPKDMSPALMHYIHFMGWKRTGWQAFTAALISLGVKKLIKIEETDDKKTKLTLTGKPDQSLPPGEAIIYRHIEGRSPLTINKSSGPALNTKRSQFMKAVTGENAKAYFDNNTGYVLGSLAISILSVFGMVLAGVLEPVIAVAAVIGTAVLLIAGFSFTAIMGGGSWIARIFITIWAVMFFSNIAGGFGMLFTEFEIDTPVIALVSIVIINFVFAWLMRAPTVQGRRLMDQIDGFKMYLETAEKHRLNMAGEPDMTVARFEAILPYAIALGVEKPWTQHFEGELARNAVSDASSGYHPGWYAGRNFSTSNLSNSVAAIGTGLSAAMISAQPSSSSSSGGGGGGFSGGGGGGGGGGGW